MRILKKIQSSLFFLLILSNGTTSYCQQIEIAEFSGTQSGNAILLNWTIKAGSTCNGIDVQRSNGVGEFEEVGQITGVCGNLSSASHYTFTDQLPIKNAVNHYRLKLGGSQISEAIFIEFIYVDENKYILKYDATNKEIRLFFINNSNTLTRLKVYNSQGIFVNEIETNSNLFFLNGEMYSNGLYYFSIFSDIKEASINGSFFVY
jgi:hypothetical protein